MKEHNKEIVFTYTGPFKDVCTQYIGYKRSLGYQFGQRQCEKLRNIDNFFKDYGIQSIILTKEMVEEYTKKRENESLLNLKYRQSAIRNFAMYLYKMGYKDIYVLPAQYMSKKESHFIPYIYTKEEISKIFNIIDNLPHSNRFKLHHIIYPALIRVLYGCGTRISETLSLKINDIDIVNSIILIQDGKGNVSRIIAMSDSLRKYIKAYIERLKLKDTDYLFPAPDGGRYHRGGVRWSFSKILEQANILNKDGKAPRIQDFRHTFSVHALEQMTDKGMDIYCALPVLSSYLGHKNIKSTEKYVRLVEEFHDTIREKSNLFYQNVFPEVSEYE